MVSHLHRWLLLLKAADFYVRWTAKPKHEFRTTRKHAAPLHKYTNYTSARVFQNQPILCSKYNSVFFKFYWFKRDNQMFIKLLPQLSVSIETKHNKNSLNGFCVSLERAGQGSHWVNWNDAWWMAGMDLQMYYKMHVLKQTKLENTHTSTILNTHKPTSIH